ncbi:DUF1878 family protein [Lysinibacillus sp. ZYM-1]|uniref:DUF1878 family protein n=1 Tax=Lysinibacillus sp. ZYM-1 TaxID=1681184 RepID=UPI0006CE877E|nr:DUF1878 family protein [Lysinibacillus sp. ZYM-1]KPN96056.1 hypothetical protein AO843_18915 [Lysinibacillus sp. ZYM-1]
MNVEQEIRQLKYQIKLLKFMVNDDEFPFFMYALDNEFEETQVNAVMKILSAFYYRLNERNDNNFHSYHELNKDDESLKTLLKTYQIDTLEIYKTELPSISEFEHYLNCIYHNKEINAKHFILNLKRQSIYKELCDYLLNQLEGH